MTESSDPAGRVTKYTYDSKGNVKTETAPDGGVWRYSWTETGELEGVTDPLGRKTTHEVNAKGLTTKTVRPDGSTLSYGYTAAGNLSVVTAPSGAKERFLYDGRGNLIEWQTAAGRTTRYSYDLANRLVSETDGEGAKTSYAYDAADNVVSQTDPLGNVTKYTYDRNGHMLTEIAPDGGVSKYAWDDLFRIAKVTDPEGGVTKYRYNREDALVGEFDPLGNEVRYQVDPMGRITEVTDPLGGVWGASLDDAGQVIGEIDPLGRETTTSYDKVGQVTSQVDAEGGEWSYEYDAVGRLVSQTDPEGGKSELVYDDLDRLIETVDPDGRKVEYLYDADDGLVAIIDEAGETTAFTLDADGLPLTVTNALGETSQTEYDKTGRITAEINELGERTEFAHDAAGQVVLQRDPMGGETLIEYDEVGRVTAVVDPAGDRHETSYDLAGRVVKEIDPLGAATEYDYDAAGRQLSTTDADGRRTVYDYDEAGQLVSVIEGSKPGADASSDTNLNTSYTYTAAGELETVTDPLGNQTKFAYDKTGRLVRQVDAGGAVSTFTYDKAGRVITQANGAGQKLTSEYTPGGLVTQATSPLGETRFEYDVAGRPISMRDSQGATAWRYDALGRVTSETSPSGQRTALDYDAVGQITQLRPQEGKEIGYRYDSLGRMVAQQTPWGDVNYEWSADSLLTGIARGDGAHTSITSDAADRVVEIVHADTVPQKETEQVKPTPKIEKPSHTPVRCEVGASGYLGARELVNLESGVPCLPTSDYLNRRELPSPADPVSAGGLLRYEYEYSAAGNVTQAQRSIEGPISDDAAEGDRAGDAAREVIERVQSAYSYDGVGRLSASVASDLTPNTGADAGPETQPRIIQKQQFGYDAAGNRVSVRTERKKETVREDLTFEGNRVTKRTVTGGDNEGTRKFKYDGAGRRVSEKGAGSAVFYEYGFTGQPVSITAGEQTTTRGYDGLGRVVAEATTGAYGSDQVTQSYAAGVPVSRSSSQHGEQTLLWGALGEISGIGSDTPDGARWALLDRLGSVVAEATGATPQDISQLVAYTDSGMPDFESTGYSQLYGYSGELQNGSTGTVAFGARSYDPGTGVWHAPDEWPGLTEAPQTLNRYAYVLGNPATLVDDGGYLPLLPLLRGVRALARKAAGVIASGVRNLIGGASRRATRTPTYSPSGSTPLRRPSVGRGGPGPSSPVSGGNRAIQHAAAGGGVRGGLPYTPNMLSSHFTQQRHPEAGARTCTSKSMRGSCQPRKLNRGSGQKNRNYRDMDFWDQHMKDISKNWRDSWSGVPDRWNDSWSGADKRWKETKKRAKDGLKTPQSPTGSVVYCMYVCGGRTTSGNNIFGVGPKTGLGWNAGMSALNPNHGAWSTSCAVGNVYYEVNVSKKPFISTGNGISRSFIFGCSTVIVTPRK